MLVHLATSSPTRSPSAQGGWGRDLLAGVKIGNLLIERPLQNSVSDLECGGGGNVENNVHLSQCVVASYSLK
jgi:hypothetical protein